MHEIHNKLSCNDRFRRGRFKISWLPVSLLMLLLLLTTVSLQHVTADLATKNADTTLIRLIDEASEPFSDIATADLDGLLERIGDSRIVLIGEATHGTAEFYDMRARITRELIENKGFTLIALEADWPDAVIVDQFIRGPVIRGQARIPVQHYRPFTSFPDWMWANHSFQEFTHWLKDYNEKVKTKEGAVSLYGLDLYNLYRSIDMVVDYLNYIDPEAADAARWHYSCMKRWARDPSQYSHVMDSRVMNGHMMRSRNDTGCSAGVSAVFNILQKNKSAYRVIDKQAYFNAEQNARLVVNGERYFRTLYHEDNTSWNQRDSNMLESLNAILQHHPAEKVIIWAHNSHIGDARAVQIAHAGKHNLGQLVRETFDDDSYHIGFGTDHGTVAAATTWKGPMVIMQVPSSHKDSYEYLFHQAKHDNFLLPLRQPDNAELTDRLMTKRMQRAIGVTYDPDNEIERHYYYALLPYQFDEYIWFDETQAVKPLSQSN